MFDRFWFSAVSGSLALLVACQGGDASREEIEAWVRAHTQSDPAAYQRYLRAYPNGYFSEEAIRILIDCAHPDKAVFAACANPGAGPYGA